MNSTASQSSSSGCVGHSPCDAEVVERPCRCRCRRTASRRLTNTRAVSGLSCETSQFARSSRVGAAGRLDVELRQERRHRRLDDLAGVVQPVAARQDAHRPRRRRRSSRGTSGTAASRSLLLLLQRRQLVAHRLRAAARSCGSSAASSFFCCVGALVRRRPRALACTFAGSDTAADGLGGGRRRQAELADVVLRELRLELERERRASAAAVVADRRRASRRPPTCGLPTCGRTAQPVSSLPSIASATG